MKMSLKYLDDDKDAYWLAQAYFDNCNYPRALGILVRRGLVLKNASCKHLAALSHIKQNQFDEALNILGDRNPSHLFTSTDRVRRKLQHVVPRNSPQKSGKTPSRSDRVDRSEDRDFELPSDIQFEAAMCYLRGLCFARQNALDRAKTCYKDAVRIDVQCFEAFDQLMTNKLMSPTEEWEFLESLDFNDTTMTSGIQDQEAASFIKMLYTTRLSKYGRPDAFVAAIETLTTHYNLATNASMMLAQAELLSTNSRFKDSLMLTSKILLDDPLNFEAIPLHVAALDAEGDKNALFLLSHELADSHPEQPATWLAVGTYYMAIDQISQARAYFSKASLMDPHFGPAWIGFAHTFAAEGEHDQAISAYSTAARLFQGTHLPQLFLGMQNLSLGNTVLAREYFNAAYAMCETDPLLLNDLGVTNYQEGLLDEAIRCFQIALKYAEDVGSRPTAWLRTRSNLGHALRKSRRFEAALNEFNEVIRHGTNEAAAFTSKGLVLMELERWFEASTTLHQALALNPQDPIATELLSRALDVLQSKNTMDNALLENTVEKWDNTKQILKNVAHKHKRRRQAGADISLIQT